MDNGPRPFSHRRSVGPARVPQRVEPSPAHPVRTLTDESGDRALAVAVEHGVDIYVRAAPLWRSMHAAAISDPEADAYVQAMAADRRAGMGKLVARLDSLGYLRQGLTADRATDLVFALFSHETFLALE